MTDEQFVPREESPSFKKTNRNSSSQTIEVELRISSKGAFRVYDEFEENDVRQNHDGSYTVQTKLPSGSWLHSYLLSFGSLIEGIEPVDLRNDILEELDTIKQQLNQNMT